MCSPLCWGGSPNRSLAPSTARRYHSQGCSSKPAGAFPFRSDVIDTHFYLCSREWMQGAGWSDAFPVPASAQLPTRQYDQPAHSICAHRPAFTRRAYVSFPEAWRICITYRCSKFEVLRMRSALRCTAACGARGRPHALTTHAGMQAPAHAWEHPLSASARAHVYRWGYSARKHR